MMMLLLQFLFLRCFCRSATPKNEQRSEQDRKRTREGTHKLRMLRQNTPCNKPACLAFLDFF
jgi:hypothetical protein